MVVMIKDVAGGPQGQFHRPGGARYEPGSGTHTIIPNRNAQITVDVGPPMIPIGSVAGRRLDNHLEGPGNPGGEVVMGTNVLAAPRTNDEFLRGLPVSSYDGPLQFAGNPEFGRGAEDLFSGVTVPRWYPQRPGDPPVEDRS